MIQLTLPDNTTITLQGEPDPAFLGYLAEACPEVWARVLAAKAGGGLQIDLAAGEVCPAPAPDQAERLLHDLRTLAALPNREAHLDSANDLALVLCGGRGARMESQAHHKVCFPIGSRSVINRALETYRRAGIAQRAVVVGAMADRVAAEIAPEHPDCVFAYQADQLGTGHAARQAAYALQHVGFAGDVMLTMGDKVISQRHIEKLRQAFKDQSAALAVTVAPKNRWPNSGRVVFRDDGQVDCSVERSEVTKRLLLQRILNRIETYEIESHEAVAELIAAEVPDADSARVMFGDRFWNMIHGDVPFGRDALRDAITSMPLDFDVHTCDGATLRLNAFELEHRCDKVNISVYYFRAEALYYALERITNDNAQGQFYLTDAIHVLSRAANADGRHRFKVIAVDVDDPEEVLSYDTQGELQYIVDRLRADAVERLRSRGVAVQGYFRRSWVDDLDTVDKIGEGTELQEPSVVDLGPDPEHTIGKRCHIQGTVLCSALGDDCVVEDSTLRNVIAGSEVAIRGTRFDAGAPQVVPSGVAIVNRDFSQLDEARTKQRDVLAQLRERYEEAIAAGKLEGPVERYMGDVDETNVFVDPRMIDTLVANGKRVRPGSILERRESDTVGEWLTRLDEFGEAIRTEFHGIYGDSPELIEERRQAYIKTLTAFGRTFGYTNRVIISRSPGRINLMGRHVDHQGGHINQMAINREVLMVVQRRHDDRVVVQNVDRERFEPVTFVIGEEYTSDAAGNWQRWVDSDEIKGRLAQTQGNWGNYVRAALFRLQDVHRSTPLYGMNMMVHGNIPIAAGLSSSSAIVVGTAEAAVRINELALQPQQFVDLCGEGEWYVGTRGGSGDHAAMKFGAKGSIAHVRFLPFHVEGFVQFPQGYRLVVCQSHGQAHKAAGTRNIFNSKVATYRLGFLLIQEKFPHHAPKLEHLRDVNAEHLGVDLAEIYEMLRALPERATRAEIREMLAGKHEDKLAEYFSTHDEPPGGYELRKVCLFGLGECARTKICPSFLRNGDIVGFGELMKISHDGDRVSRRVDGGMEPYDNEFRDTEIDGLIADLRSGAPERVERAQMHHRPGGYGCSTEGIDFMVDTACAVEGVAGAQLAGAGLGGCIMVLVKDEAVPALVERLTAEYYNNDPEEAKQKIEACVPIDGSGAIEF